ncbi:unnamed protein product, partial [Cyprideis torosa]
MEFYSLLLTLCVCVVDNLHILVNAFSDVTMENTPAYQGQCDPPFTAVNGGHCYFFSYDVLSADWTRAQLICSWLHPKGQLAEFETLQEIVDATLFLNSDNNTYGWGSVGPWIGATSKNDLNEFMWHSSKAPVKDHNWAESRPQSSTSGDGVALDVSDHFQWIDLNRGTDLPFLCEIPRNPAPVGLKCPDSFFSLGKSCYFVFEKEADKRSWDAAQKFCRSKAAGSRLVELETKEENDLLMTHLQKNGYHCHRYWIGAQEIGNTDTYFWASTGQVVVFYDWTPGQPNEVWSGVPLVLSCDPR